MRKSFNLSQLIGNFFTSRKWLPLCGMLSVFILNACGGGGGGAAPPDPGPYTVAGTVTPVSTSRIDSDVNDPDYAFDSNDTFADAQDLPNPVTLGGFASVTGSGLSNSNFASVGDTTDFFQVQLFAGQVVGLKLASQIADLDLILYDSGQNELARPQLGVGQNESITVPGSFSGSRAFYIEVRAIAGVSNYTLTAGLSLAASDNDLLARDFVPGEVIVRFRDTVLPAGVSTDSLEMRAQAVGLKAVSGAPGRSMLMRLVDSAPPSAANKAPGLGIAQHTANTVSALQRKLDTIRTVEALKQRADVDSVRLNHIYRAAAIPNDPDYASQWHFPLINLPAAWDVSTGSANVIVAAVDTGVLLNHPDLANKLVPGFDFIRDPSIAADGQSAGIIEDIDSDPNDPGDRSLGSASSFHGTHVAGIIAAETNNAVGVAGIGWNVRVMPLRALGLGGSGTAYDVEQAVLYAAGLPNDSGTVPAQKADIINLSLGGPGGSGATPDAYKQARDAGVIIVAAAGNGSSSVPEFPASYDDAVISVSALARDKARASYSNFNCFVDVAAPGGDGADSVMSTVGSDISPPVTFTYGLKQGTSMAAPHIAGVAALMKSVYPGLTPAQFENALKSGLIIEDLGAAGRDDQYGYGMIDALKAVQTAQQLNDNQLNLADDPFLAVSQCALNFGVGTTNLSLTLRDTGSGATPLTGITVTVDTGGTGSWLSYDPPANGTGLGDYTFRVNRTGLVNETYLATINIASSVNSVSVPVVMQVTSAVAPEEDAGLHYFLLYDPATSSVLKQVTDNVNSGVYNYQFDDVDAGEYQVYAGTDLNNDGAICDPGEACGFYPDASFSSNTFILNADLVAADFLTRFDANFTSNTLLGASTSGVPVRGIALKRIQP